METKKQAPESEAMSIITSALSGLTGGGLFFSWLGIPGVIVGGAVGAIVTGFSEYRKNKDHDSRNEKEKMQEKVSAQV